MAGTLLLEESTIRDGTERTSKLLTLPVARMLYHTSDLSAEVNPTMSRKQGKAVPECNGPVPHHDEFGSDEPTMVDLYRIL